MGKSSLDLGWKTKWGQCVRKRWAESGHMGVGGGRSDPAQGGLWQAPEEGWGPGGRQWLEPSLQLLLPGPLKRFLRCCEPQPPALFSAEGDHHSSCFLGATGRVGWDDACAALKMWCSVQAATATKNWAWEATHFVGGWGGCHTKWGEMSPGWQWHEDEIHFQAGTVRETRTDKSLECLPEARLVLLCLLWAQESEAWLGSNFANNVDAETGIFVGVKFSWRFASSLLSLGWHWSSWCSVYHHSCLPCCSGQVGVCVSWEGKDLKQETNGAVAK